MIKRTALCLILLSISCNNQDQGNEAPHNAIDLSDYFTIDFNSLPNYANQAIPDYITKDNTNTNPITNMGATLGRILFYDKNLSADNTVSCASCHQQAHAFSDLNNVSNGVNGNTARHSMRLINVRFAQETRFFWDERATTLEQQTTMPIQDHAEMGFSGLQGAPNFSDLITKLEGLPYYPTLFNEAFGNETISETSIQNALAQFIRSIQSFDSKYDQGRVLVANHNEPFPNFSASENNGKILFSTPPNFDANGNRLSGGLGCNTCHNAPEFDIDPNSLNNGIIDIIGSTDQDITITRAPTLRDLFNSESVPNGAFMHSAISSDIFAVIEHYDNGITNSPNLDPRLLGGPGGNGQRLQMSLEEKENLLAFLKTLSGTAVYHNEKWANPFIE